MKGIKKGLLLALSLAMSATLFAACGGGNEDNGSSSAGGNTESSSALGGNSSEVGGGSSGNTNSSEVGGGDNSESGEVELPDTSVEIPDVDGAPVANEAEWNTVFQNSFSATNATIITTASENGTVMENGVVMIAGGVTYEKWDNKDGTSSYYFWGEVDGQSYQWQSKDGKTWTAEETARTPEDYATVAYELKGLDKMLSFASATWNAETGMYTGDSEEGAFSLKISDGKVVYISFYMESAMMPGVDVVYNIVYGETPTLTVPDMPKEDNGGGDIELPEIPDVDGEEVKDATAWAQIWANTNAADNFTLISTDTYKGETETAVGVFSDGKSYTVYADANGVYEYEYYGTVDGRNYKWESEDGKTWEVEEVYTDITRYTTGVGFVRGLDQMIDYSAVKYEKGYYLFSVQGMNFQVKVSGGYVVELNMSADGESLTYKFAYGDAEVGELPALPQGVIGEEIKSAGDWADVIANTSAQTNFTCNTVGRADREDGKISVMKEYTAVDNGKVYVESVSSVHNSSGGAAMGTQNSYYQGYVDGVAYEWRDMGGEWYVEEITEVEDYTIVELLGLDDLDFNTAKFDGETGGYAFTADGAVITVRVVDGLIAFVELKTETMFGEFTLTYGDASVELPSLDGGIDPNPENPSPENPNPDTGVDYSDIQFTFDVNVGQGIVGEEVTDAELKNAIKTAMGSTNFTMQGKSYVQGGASLISANVANGKMYNATKATYPTETGEYETTTLYMIVGTVNGVDWAWMSFDGVNFEDGPAEDVIRGGWRNGNDVFGPYLQIFFASEYTFNENTGEYIVEADGMTIAIKIVGGEVKTIYMTDGDMEILYVLTYGNALNFNLPPVTDGGDIGGSTGGEMPSQEEWDYAFETLLTCNNVGMKTFDDRSYLDGTESKTVASYAITETAIEYIVEQTASDGTQTYQRIVLANENGEDTMYTFSNETDIWTKADSAFISAADLWGMQTYSLKRFAGIYEQMKWDAGIGYFYLEEFTYITGDGNKYDPIYDIYIMIDGGQVMEITYKVKESEYSSQVSYVFYGYNDMKVTIPVDGQGDIGGESGGDVGGDDAVGEQVDEAGWNAAFEALLNSKNHSLKMAQNVEYYDVSETLEVNTHIKMTETAVYQDLTQKTTTADSATESTDYSVWTEEEGVNYEYSLSAESGVWEKAETSVTIDRLFQQTTSMFEIFADMYGVMTWEADGGYFFVSEYKLTTADGTTGNTLYDVCVMFENGNVVGISYRMDYGTYGGVLDIYLYDYDTTTVSIPTVGSSNNDNDDGESGGDVGGDEFVKGEEIVENDKVIVDGEITIA